MTFEEIQHAIEGMLSVQRELQNSQLRFEVAMDIVKQSITELTERFKATDERFKATDRRFEQLIGYSINRE